MPKISSNKCSTFRFKPKQLFPTVQLEDKIFLPFFVFYLLGLSFIFFIVQRIRPQVFIDEFFHVAQSQKYCLYDNFTYWDNKITTPPGLYLSSYLVLKPIKLSYDFLSKSFKLPYEFEPCSVLQHRFTNVLFSFACFFVLKSIFEKNQHSSSNAGLFSLSLILFPPLFFPFTFLYYTDLGSLFTLLLLFKHSQNNIFITIFGFISLLFRQTNIVWIFFIASRNILYEIFRLLEDVIHFSRHEFFFGGFRSGYFHCSKRNFCNLKYSFYFLLHLLWRIVSQSYGYIINAVIFLIFLYLNRGIVLGDKSAHQASFHLSQIPYFLTFSGLFGLPILANTKNFKNFTNFLVNQPFNALLLLTFLTICLSEKFTFVHPYLLADNRHYTFYLWKKLWNKNIAFRYGAVPVYGFIAHSMFTNFHVHSVLKKNNSPFEFYEKFISKFIFIFLVIISIVPQQLIEFRYFIVPFIFWRLNIRKHFYLPETVYFVFINVLVVSIFVMKTIKYSESDPDERIIW